MRALAVGTLLSLVVALPAQAHSNEEIALWQTSWTERVFEVGGLTTDLMSEWIDMADRHPCQPPFGECRATHHVDNDRPPPNYVEDLRGLVASYFKPADVNLALRVIACESRGDASVKNPRSTASGLFQHLASYWPNRSAKAGWAGASIWNPEANTAVAAWLVYHNGGWSHWNASRGCWG